MGGWCGRWEGWTLGFRGVVSCLRNFEDSNFEFRMKKTGVLALTASRIVAPASRRSDRRRPAATDAGRVRTGGRDGRFTSPWPNGTHRIGGFTGGAVVVVVTGCACVS